jgi:DNA-binding PadR family transcriptional regulator
MSITINLKKDNIDVETLYPRNEISKTGERILYQLFKSEDQSKYDIYDLKLDRSSEQSIKGITYPNIRKTIYKLIQNGFILISDEVASKIPNKKKQLYRITEKGLDELLHWSYFICLDEIYNCKSNTEREKLYRKYFRDLREIFSKMIKNKSPRIPQIFIELPVEYCISFYPFFNELQLTPFLELLRAAREKTNIIIDNGFFKNPVPMTKKEVKIIKKYLKKNKGD